MRMRRNSISTVPHVARRATGGVTAAFMLLCSLYCACAGAASSSSCHRVEQLTAGTCASHCPTRDDSTPADAPAPKPAGAPLGDPPQHAGCTHCHLLAATAGTTNETAASHGFDGPAAACPLPTSLAGGVATAAGFSVRGDLPPPVTPHTLLSLHCALNT